MNAFNPKYQVFVSSTYIDLKDERDLVIKAALEMGHIPVGMEMFSAADEEQWAIIKKQIEQSDYYIVIVAHRYGALDAKGLSYTEKEYDYAISIGLPVLGFIIDETSSWPKEKSETGKKIITKLNNFKTKVKLKPVSFWKNKEDLYGKCSIALMKAFRAFPREGWVRASQARDDLAAREVIRLSAENASLRDRIAGYEKIKSKQDELNDVIAMLKSNKTTLRFFKKDGLQAGDGPELTFYQIYESVAPQMQVEIHAKDLSKYFARVLCHIPSNEIASGWAVPRNMISLLLADFSALACIAPSLRKKPVSDTNEYWCLTEFGRDVLACMRRRRLKSIERSEKVVVDVDDV